MLIQDLAIDLMRLPSLTPDDAGCTDYLVDQLTKLGFVCEDYSRADTTNLWARYGTGDRLVVFVGHTDVVPPGDLSHWASDPFKPQVRDGVIIGRGAVDMKGALAAMLHACQRFFADKPALAGCSFAWAITSDEEETGVNGTPALLDALGERSVAIDYVLVGEPTSSREIGDTLRVARRGSLTGRLTILGKQGHAAYASDAHNAIAYAAPLLQALSALRWSSPDLAVFPDATLQCVNVQSGLGVSNVIPGELSLEFNIRYAPNVSVDDLQREIIAQVEAHVGTDYRISWQHNACPYASAQSAYIESCARGIESVTAKAPVINGGGGTSDGRHFATSGAQVVELGLCHAGAHCVNESVPVKDLESLSELYFEYLNRMLL